MHGAERVKNKITYLIPTLCIAYLVVKNKLAYLNPTLYIAYLMVNSLFSTKILFSTVFDASNFARDSNSTAARDETITLTNIYICI